MTMILIMLMSYVRIYWSTGRSWMDLLKLLKLCPVLRKLWPCGVKRYAFVDFCSSSAD